MLRTPLQRPSGKFRPGAHPHAYNSFRGCPDPETDSESRDPVTGASYIRIRMLPHKFCAAWSIFPQDSATPSFSEESIMSQGFA